MAWSPIGRPSRERPTGNAVDGWPATVETEGYTRPRMYGAGWPLIVSFSVKSLSSVG